MTRRLVIAVLTLMAVSSASQARACECSKPASTSEQFRDTDLVYVGVVERIRGPDSIGNLRVDFDVSKVWKGKAVKRATVLTWRSIATCGYRFVAGSKYVVYASRESPPSAPQAWYRTSICSGTHEYKEGELPPKAG